MGEQGWGSGESTCLPPMWPRFDSRTRRHMWVEFVVGFRPCSEVFLRVLWFFSPNEKPTFPTSSSTYKQWIKKPLCTGGDNSNKRCLSNTRSQLKSSRKFGSSSRILGIHSRMSRFFSAMSRNYRVFPGKISKCPDSRRNLQIPGTILALSRNSVC